MNRKSRVSFGPGAASLILIVVILSMSVLGILSLMSARSDSRLSDRSAQVVEAACELSCRAERTLSELDALAVKCRGKAADDEEYLSLVEEGLSADMDMEDRTISWTEEDEARTLECAVELLPMGDAERYSWRVHRLSAVTEEIWN